ncbi:MAG: hypothetical protein AVDCRST_MAG93-1341, partial [uncultured Chloroflexia bacterium]
GRRIELRPSHSGTCLDQIPLEPDEGAEDVEEQLATRRGGVE